MSEDRDYGEITVNSYHKAYVTKNKDGTLRFSSEPQHEWNWPVIAGVLLTMAGIAGAVYWWM